eukprot:m.155154 g.155154  ORF g.155154 m.155154 type:complete len:642 (-) comp30927_c0_seq1:241-2166(-)
MAIMFAFLLGLVSTTVASPSCTFCGVDSASKSHTFDLSTLSNVTFQCSDSNGRETYAVTSPCLGANTPSCGPQQDPMLQSCRGVGTLVGGHVDLNLTANGFVLTLHGGFNVPPMKDGRNAVYNFICDMTVPMDNAPSANVTEDPPGFYSVDWRHPSACKAIDGPATCGPPPPAPPAPPPAASCMPGSDTCLPSWKPTWHMRNSTVLYTCNNSGMHNVTHANQFGIVVYDWSNAKAIWANAHPMTSEELITKQAEMVYAQDPGLPGYAPRVWAYRNTIKALNWYSSVREKLDDPKYASWFIKFKGFSNTPYPGGTAGQSANGSYHVPTCDWYNNGTAPRCSGFYHDQEQTPEHPGGGRTYRVDGDCIEQCDCGGTNPCAEYIFDHRGGEVEGRTFRDWWINEYMITNETLFHKNPVTGEPQVIGLGWLDDSMTPNGPTEEDKNYIADTGASPEDMAAQVAAYRESVLALKEKVIPMGGFWWQLMDTGGMKLNGQSESPVSPDECKTTLKSLCVPEPSGWKRLQMYNIPHGGKNCTAQNFTDYTAEFLLTRGPYAMLGYSWCGCTNGNVERPRATEWDSDFGEPVHGAACEETSMDSGVYKREWTEATVQWDCNTGHGSITPHATEDHGTITTRKRLRLETKK